jgi:hypothetical protein
MIMSVQTVIVRGKCVDEEWVRAQKVNHWELPAPANWPWRLPVVRHFRALWLSIRVERHERFWRSIGSIPTGYDQWVIYGIARGVI